MQMLFPPRLGGFFMKNIKNTKLSYFLPLICSIAAILSLLGVDLIYKIENGGSSESFSLHLWDLFNANLTPIWPIIVILVLISLGGLLPLLYLIKQLEKNENIAIISTFLFLIGLVFLVAEKELFSIFAKNIIDDFKSAKVSYGIALAILFSSFGAIISLFASPKQYGDNVKAITEDGILIALAFVLSFAKIPIGATGGSINFQMLPLFIIALRRGPLHAFVSGGIIYGFLSCLVDGYGFLTFPFDYLLGFGSAAILGLFRTLILDENKNFAYRLAFIFVGGLLATLMRFIASTASSMIYYEYPLVGALEYNAIYVPLSGAISVAALMVFFKPFTYINRHYPIGENE